MLALFSLIAGFVSPWIGDVFKLFQARQNNAHELAMLVESNKSAREVAELNAQVSLAQSDTDDVRSARSATPSYGVALLDAVHDSDGWIERCIVKPVLLMSLTLVEVANGLMRPYAIYMILSLWASTKVAKFYLIYTSTSGGELLDYSALAGAALAIWEDHDWAALDYALGFLLGSRHKLKEAGAK